MGMNRRGLPAPPASLTRMLPADALAGSAALVVGEGFLADVSRRALESVGASVSVLRGPRAGEEDMDSIRETLGSTGADVLITTPPPAEPTRAEDLDYRGYRALMQRTFDTVYLATTAFATSRGTEGGSIINLTDVTALTGAPGVAARAGAEAGVVSLGRSLAAEWAPRDIRVNTVAIGQFDGREDKTAPGNLPALRLGEPRELEWLISYLASPYSAYVTGATIAIDGGDALRHTLLESTPYQEDEFLQ